MQRPWNQDLTSQPVQSGVDVLKSAEFFHLTLRDKKGAKILLLRGILAHDTQRIQSI